MHKVDGPGHSAGQFVAEDLLNATPGTQITEDWLNAVQAEIVNVIEGAGFNLNKSDNTQLRTAILQMVSGADLTCRFTTTGNITLSGLATRTGGDWSVALTAGDLILVKDQTVQQNNGWYVAAAGTWSRVSYLDSSAEIVAGKLTKVTQGVTLADSLWMLTTDAPIVLNSSALTFVRKDADDVPDATTTTKGKVQLGSSSDFSETGDTAKAQTAASIITGLLGSGGASGNDYIKLPFRDDNSQKKYLIIQFGRTGSIPPASNITYTFPIAFPNAVSSILITRNDNSGSSQRSDAVNSYTLTNAVIDNGSPSHAAIFSILAVGY